jgi:hypothetical protein
MKQIFSTLFLVIGSVGFAQTTETPEIEPIEADRPDQTETPSIVPKGMFQMENGFVFEKDGNAKTFVTPTSLWKYGVNENFELRLITELSFTEADGQRLDGLNPVKVGFKAKLFDEKGIIPKTSIIAHLQIPDLASKSLKADYYAALFRFTMQHTLSDKFTLGYNLGAEWDGLTPNATFIYTLTGGFSITDDLGCYAEIFGFAPEEETAYHSIDGGFTYLLSNDFMLDASAGFGITENAPDYYVSLGFSFRL